MSSSSTSAPSWGDVINSFIQAIESILYNIGQYLVQYAGVIASVLIGVGIVVFLVRGIRRIPFVSNFLNNFL